MKKKTYAQPTLAMIEVILEGMITISGDNTIDPYSSGGSAFGGGTQSSEVSTRSFDLTPDNDTEDLFN